MDYEIKHVERRKIKLNKDNPRYIKEAEFDKLKRSLLSFPEMLQAKPLGIANGVVLGGNMRLRAVSAIRGLEPEAKERIREEQLIKRQEAGHTEQQLKEFVEALHYLFAATTIPVIDVTTWPEEQRREYVIKDNANYGEWDSEELANGWADVDLQEWGVYLPIAFEEEDFDDDDNNDDGTSAGVADSTTKKITLMYDDETYKRVLHWFEEKADEYNCDDNFGAVILKIMEK